MSLKDLSIAELEARYQQETDLEQKSLIDYVLAQKYHRSDVAKGFGHLRNYAAFAKQTNDPEHLFKAHNAYGIIYNSLGNIQQSLDHYKKALLGAEALNDLAKQAQVYNGMSNVLANMGMLQDSLEMGEKAYQISKGLSEKVPAYASNLGSTYIQMGQPEKALPYVMEALEMEDGQIAYSNKPSTLQNLGFVYLQLGNYAEAEKYLLECIAIGKEYDDEHIIGAAKGRLAELKIATGDLDAAELLVQEAHAVFEALNNLLLQAAMIDIHAGLHEKRNDLAEALKYHKKYQQLREKVISEQAMRKANNIEVQMELERKEQQLQLERAEHKEALAKQKLESFTSIVSNVAHEIQNPLQFVNNFSVMNNELAQDMLQAIDQQDMEELRALVADMVENSAKIHQHGQRISSYIDHLNEQTREGNI